MSAAVGMSMSAVKASATSGKATTVRAAGMGSVATISTTAPFAKSVSMASRKMEKTVVSQARDVSAKAVSTSAPPSADLSGELLSSNTSKTVLSIILGGGAGSRLYPLTKKRAKPAVPLGANYRLIDIPVSNCLNSNVNKIYCLTQYNSASLNRHLAQAFNANIVGLNSSGFVEVLAAQQSPTNPDWFQGTADAVRQYLWLFEDQVSTGIEDYLILSGDHLYRMDYEKFVQGHRAAGADITVGALPMDEARATAFGLMKINDTGRIIDFAEKPEGDLLKSFQVDTTVLGLDAAAAKESPYIASMGIYVFKASAMLDLLTKRFPDADDFGSEVIPGANDIGMHVQAYLFPGYWEDIGTVSAFYNSNLALTETDAPKFSFYDRQAPIFTMARYLPPSKFIDADVTKSIIGDGCLIKNATVKHSVVGLRAQIGDGALIEDAMIMGSDYYETDAECMLMPHCMPLGVGPGSVVKNAIVDKNVRIGKNCSITNKDNVQEDFSNEENGWIIRDHIVVIIKDSIIPDGTII